jgi:type IV secretion system protein VirB6
MFAWVGAKFDAVLSTYVLSVVSKLITGIAPLALTAMTMWVMLYGWAVVRGEVSESVPTFVWKTFKIGLVLSFALHSGVYISSVSETANGLALGVATTFLPAAVDPSTVSSPYALLDTFNDAASAQVADIMKEASMFRLDLLLAAAIFSIGSVVFLCIGLFVVTLSKMFLAFTIAVGPLFILCLAWKPTARFFDSWLSMLLNAVVLTWFAFFALGLSTYVGDNMFKAIHDGGGFLGESFNVLGEATRYSILMILMGIICFQAPSLASALTGGAAVQQGVQMAQNVMMVAGLRSASSAAARGSAAMGSGAAGGVVCPGLGIAHAAGAATGSMAMAGMRTAGTMATGAGAMARHGYGAARTAAYKLAALRGRTAS